MSEEEKIRDEELPDTGSPLPEEKPENQKCKSEEVNADIVNEAAQPKTTNYKLKTPAMEVHHHGHVHEKKKWKEYVFQFFMLFLAVFCGFLAEYQLEQTIERHREKDYMQLMVEDLQKDTAMLNILIPRSERVLKRLDTITHILYDQKLTDSLIKKAYELNLNILQGMQLTFTDRTSSQLKNAGALRLVKKTTVIENLFNYWTQADELKNHSEVNNSLRMLAREKSYSIFNAKYYSTEKVGTRLSNDIIPELMTTDISTLTEFSNRLVHIRNGIHYIYIPRMKVQFSIAVKLIALIREEYNFK